MREVDGKVWNAQIDPRELAAFEQRVPILNVYNKEDGDLQVRYLADTAVIPGSIKTEPRMEDLYLWLFPEHAREEAVR